MQQSTRAQEWAALSRAQKQRLVAESRTRQRREVESDLRRLTALRPDPTRAWFRRVS